jgi:hypothetical protein
MLFLVKKVAVLGIKFIENNSNLINSENLEFIKIYQCMFSKN